jgi:hypothetical protein
VREKKKSVRVSRKQSADYADYTEEKAGGRKRVPERAT